MVTLYVLPTCSNPIWSMSREGKLVGSIHSMTESLFPLISPSPSSPFSPWCFLRHTWRGRQGGREADILALKHISRIFGHCNNPALPFCPVCGCGISSCSVLKYWLWNEKQEVLCCCNVRKFYWRALDRGYLPRKGLTAASYHQSTRTYSRKTDRTKLHCSVPSEIFSKEAQHLVHLGDWDYSFSIRGLRFKRFVSIPDTMISQAAIENQKLGRKYLHTSRSLGSAYRPHKSEWQ